MRITAGYIAVIVVLLIVSRVKSDGEGQIFDDLVIGFPWILALMNSSSTWDTALFVILNSLTVYLVALFFRRFIYADKDGNPCNKQTIGLLNRRRVRIRNIKFIGKESNSLEDVESGLVQSAQNVYTECPDPSRDEWDLVIRPALRKPQLRILVHECRGRYSRRALIDLRAGNSRPHRKNRQFLASVLRKLGLL
jgi:hypothetical protein